MEGEHQIKRSLVRRFSFFLFNNYCDKLSLTTIINYYGGAHQIRQSLLSVCSATIIVTTLLQARKNTASSTTDLRLLLKVQNAGMLISVDVEDINHSGICGEIFTVSVVVSDRMGSTCHAWEAPGGF